MVQDVDYTFVDWHMQYLKFYHRNMNRNVFLL